MDLKLLDAVHALEGGKTLEGHLGCAGDKLQELSPVCLVKGPQGSPEPLNLKNKQTNKHITKAVELKYVPGGLILFLSV